MNTGGAGERQVRRENHPNLTTDEVFEILKNERRRAVIRYLCEHEGYAELAEVAEHIAAVENDTSVRQLTSQERKRVHIALYQCHLPKMDSIGIVEYDKDRGTIELQNSVSEVEPYLNLGPADDRTSSSSDRVMVAIAVGTLALVTAGTVGLGSLSSVPPAGWTLVSVLAMVVIVGRQYGG